MDEEIKCSDCGAIFKWKTPPKSNRLPSGWKRYKGLILCPACWGKRFILRAVIIPVSSPLDCTWPELNTALHAMWATTTSAANWMMSEFYTRDAKREPGATKMPPMPKIYLYPQARPLFPMLPSQSISALEQATGKKYRAARRDVMWKFAASLPTYRYPTPFGVPNQGWSVAMEDQRPVVSVRIGDERLRLRLKSGAEFSRQLKAVRQIVAGDAEQGQLDIYRRGRGKTASIMVKMVAWLPRAAARTMDGTLVVRSTDEALLQAFNLKDEAIWTYHGDQVRRWIAEHRKMLQRLSDDSKAELRPTPPFTEHRKLAVERFHRRMSSATHAIAAMLVGYAQRRKFAAIQYDDSNHTFADAFPWATLRLKVAEKADAAGVVFAGAPVEEEEEAEPVGQAAE